jgi:hypothetical protein
MLYLRSCFQTMRFQTVRLQTVRLQYLYTHELFQKYQIFHCVVKQNSVTFNQTAHRFEFGNLINSFALS